MVCGNCGHEYKIKEGIANFLLPSHLGELITLSPSVGYHICICVVFDWLRALADECLPNKSENRGLKLLH